MTAAKLVLEPIFEADFLPSSYGFRPKRSAHQACDAVRAEAAHVGAVEAKALRAALAAGVVALMGAGAETRLPHADTVAQRLAELG
jgi:hypothetical protein